MPNSVVISGREYAAYITILAGEGGGPLIYIDYHGHIVVNPGGPPIPGKGVELLEAGVRAVREGIKQIQQGIEKGVTAAPQAQH